MKTANAVETAESYYDSSDADTFYYTVWGGEDIHVGCYTSPDEDIAKASHRTVVRMAERLPNLKAGDHVLDLGAGYGGAGRYLARQTGCKVTCLNLSEVQNEVNRRQTEAAGLSELVRVVHGSFEDVPEPDDSVDVVWSQDAFLHSGNREQVISEIARVGKPGAEVVFTDPMQTDDAPASALTPILNRIHLDTLGSPGFYREAFARHGFEEVAFIEKTEQLKNHYSAVAQVLKSRYDEMVEKCSQNYVDNMLRGLGHWVEGAERGHLVWGIFHFRHTG